MRSLAVPLALLALPVLAVGVRESRFADVELHDEMFPLPLNMEGDEVEATQLINKLEVAILTRNQGMSVESYLESKFSARTARDCDATSAPQHALYIDGWVCLLRPFGLSESEAKLLMNMLGTPDAGQKKALLITLETVKGAILGQGAEEERDQVLEAVWQKVTGKGPGEGAALVADNLVCKKPNTREAFINWMKEQVGAASSAPLTYDIFHKYYRQLGEKIISHRLFVLMVVNAWHIMDPPYNYVNTANLRVRAVKEGEDRQGGKIYALIDDCGAHPGEESLNEIQRIKKRLEAQTGETFQFISKSDRVG